VVRRPNPALGRAASGRSGASFGCLLLAAALLVAFVLPAAAEVSSSVTLSAYGTLARVEGGAAVGAYLRSRLDVQSVGNENVRGQLQLDGYVADVLFVDVPRAWIKVRLPWLRITVGKTRLSWGEGFVFNAGDVIFGSMNPLGGDLTAAVLRDETAWLASLYVPLGSFSFVEAAVLPFGVPDDTTSLSTVLGDLPNARRMEELAGGAGLRGVFRIGNVKVEPGWFSTWAAREHRPYVSLQGHLLADWNLSAVLNIPFDDPDWSAAGPWLGLSAGLFRLTRLGGDRSLALRLEAAIWPGAAWQEAPGASAPVYGLQLFPEAVLALSPTVSLELRGLVSPVDGSGLGLLGVSWGVYQGLSLSGYVSIAAGDEDDLYSWEMGPALLLGAEFTY
jgi:hypothetical protein